MKNLNLNFLKVAGVIALIMGGGSEVHAAVSPAPLAIYTTVWLVSTALLVAWAITMIKISMHMLNVLKSVCLNNLTVFKMT